MIVRERLLDDAALALHRRDDDDGAAVEPELVEDLSHGHRAGAQRGRQLLQHVPKLDIPDNPERTQLLHPGLERRVEPSIDLFQVVGASAHGADREHELNRLERGGL